MAVAELEHEPQSRPVLRLTAKPPRLYRPFETSEMCPENAHLSVPKSRDSTRLKETPPSAPQADARSAGNFGAHWNERDFRASQAVRRIPMLPAGVLEAASSRRMFAGDLFTCNHNILTGGRSLTILVE